MTRFHHEFQCIEERAVVVCTRVIDIHLPRDPRNVVHELVVAFVANHVDVAPNQIFRAIYLGG